MRYPASLASLLFVLAVPAVAQDGAAKDFELAVCNGGKIPFDAFAAVNTPPAVVNIAPDACRQIYAGGKNDPAYVGFAFPDAKGKWGGPRRYDFMPALPKSVLTRANQNVAVRRGNQTVTTAAQFTFRPEPRVCSTSEVRVDPFDSRSGKTFQTTCSHYYYEIIVAAYADSHELSFLTDCERCPAQTVLTPEQTDLLAAANDIIAGGAYTQKAAGAVHKAVESQMSGRPRKRPDFTPHLQHWPEFLVALASAGASGGMPPGVPRVITVRGTVSKIEEAAPNAAEHWIDIFFKEAPDGRFHACSLGPEILSEVYGPNFRTALIGQVIEVEGDIQRYYCKGFQGSVRISLAHQTRRSDATQLTSVITPRTPPAPAPAKVEKLFRDPAMPNYDLDEDNIAAQLQRYCSALFDPAELTPKQQEIRRQYANKVAFEVSYCKNQFDTAEVQRHRRLAMEYCLGNYEFTNARVAADAYDVCMRQNDELVSLCSLKPNSHRVISVANPGCDVRPNPQEKLAVMKKLKDAPGGPGAAPGLPPFLTQMNPGTIEALAPTPAVSPQPVVRATPPQPAVTERTNPGAAPAAPQASPRLTPEAARQRQQQFAACRRQAAADFPRGGADFIKAMTDCNKILQQK